MIGNKLTNRQKELIISGLIGWFEMKKTKKGKIQIIAEEAPWNKKYITILSRNLDEYREEWGKVEEWGKEGAAWKMELKENEEIEEYYNRFYKNEKKRLPEKIEEWMTPGVIAHWYMSIHEGKESNYIWTKGYTGEENKKISEILREKYKIKNIIEMDKFECDFWLGMRPYKTKEEEEENKTEEDRRWEERYGEKRKKGVEIKKRNENIKETNKPIL